MTTVGDMLYQMGGVPVGAEFTTGSVFFVDSNTGSNSNDGKSPDTALATLDYAIGKCTASKGDIIYLMPGHAETTTAIAADVIGVTVKGIGRGTARPTLTASTTASDLIDVSAASFSMENVLLVGAASGNTGHIHITSADNTFTKVEFQHGAAPTTSVNIASGVRNKFYGCRWLGTANGPAISISFTSASENDSKDFEVIDCIFNYGLFGLDTAAITNAAVATQEGGVILDCIFSGMDATGIDFNSSSSASCRGIACGLRMVGSGALTIANAYDFASYGPLDCLATDAPTASSPNSIPATTAS